MERFFDLLKISVVGMIRETNRVISLLLVLNLIVAVVVTKPWQIRKIRFLLASLTILFLLPLLLVAVGSILAAPAGFSRSIYALQPTMIYGLFLLDLLYAIWMIYKLNGIRWFASGISLVMLWFSVLCLSSSIIAVCNLFI